MTIQAYSTIQDYVDISALNLNKLSTGLELNESANDSSNLAIALKFLSESNSYTQAIQNSNEGLAMMNIADRAVGMQSEILDQVQQKMVQASSDTVSEDGRNAILKDVQSLMTQYDTIASTTSFSGQTILQKSADDQSESDYVLFQTGADAKDDLYVGNVQLNTQGIGMSSIFDEDSTTFTADKAKDYLGYISNAIDRTSEFRNEFSSTATELQTKIRTLMSDRTKTELAKSVLLDVDYAKESEKFSTNNLMAQIGMLTSAQGVGISQVQVNRLLL